MRFIYADESGISAKEPVALVAGVMVDVDKQWLKVKSHVDELINEYVPQEHRANFSFHAKDLYRCSGKIFGSDKYPRERAREALKRLLAIPSKFQLPISVGYVRKQYISAEFDRLRTRDKDAIFHAFAFALCTVAAEYHMRKAAGPSELAKIIAENNATTQKAVRCLHKLLEGKIAHEALNKFMVALPDVYHDCVPLRRVVDTVHFAEKDDAILLQIADACSYVLRFSAMGETDQYIDELLDILTDNDRQSLGQPLESFASVWYFPTKREFAP